MTNFTTNPAPQPSRPPVIGGLLAAADAIDLMNAWFFVSEINGEVSISRIEDDGTLTHFGLDDLQLLLSNTFVEVGNRHVPISKFWLIHHRRRQSKIVFKPRGNVEVDEYNPFLGFAVAPVSRNRRLGRSFRHLWKIIRKRGKISLKYLMPWLACCVQNADRRAEVIEMLMSEAEGCSPPPGSPDAGLFRRWRSTACWLGGLETRERPRFPRKSKQNA